MTDAPKPRTRLLASSDRRELSFLALLTLTYFFLNTDSQVMYPLQPAIREGLSLPEGAVSWLNPLYGILAAITSIVMGFLMDRYRVGRLLPLGFLFFSIGQVVNLSAPSIGVLIAGRMITGVGAATLSLGMMVRISEVFGERQHEAFGIFVTGAAGAVAIGLPASSWIESQWGWRAPFAFFLVGVTILGLAVTLMQPPGGLSSNGEETARVRRRLFTSGAFRDLLGRRRQKLILLLGLVFNAGMYALLNMLAIWCADKFGLETTEIFTYYIFGGLAAVVVGPLSGRLSRRVGLIPVITFGTVALMVMLPVFALAPNAVILMPLFIIVFALAVLRLVPYQVLTLQAAASGQQARFVGLRNSISQLGIFVGGAIGALIYTQMGLGYFSVGLWGGITCAIALVMLRAIGREEASK